MRALLIPLTAGILLAAGAVAPAQAAPAATGDVQLVTPYDLTQLRHTIRHADGTWQPWGTVGPTEGQEAIGLSSVVINGVDHVLYYSTTTHMPTNYQARQMIRDAAGNWSIAPVPDGTAAKASLANLNGHLALVTETKETELKLSVQQDNGGWSAWETVPTGGDSIEGFDVTATGGVLRVVLFNHDGSQIGDIDRAADGTWSQPNWIPFTGGSFPLVSVAQVGADLQVVVTAHGADGTASILHTIRHADGSWDRFGDVRGAAGAVPDPYRVAVTSSRGELQMAVATGDHLYHTIRHADGTWQRFGDVMSVAGTTYAGDVTIAGQ